MRQNARPILVFDGFKSVISVIKYQQFMPDPSDQVLQQITKVRADLNAQLAKLKLLHLFAAPPAWAKNTEPTQP